jgi:hypothetical protein
MRKAILFCVLGVPSKPPPAQIKRLFDSLIQNHRYGLDAPSFVTGP